MKINHLATLGWLASSPFFIQSIFGLFYEVAAKRLVPGFEPRPCFGFICGNVGSPVDLNLS
jgi:hypothetical protein